MGQQFPQSGQPYQGGYPQQQFQQQRETPQTRPAMQEVKFYKSGFFGFRSAAGKFQRDCQRMTTQGYRLHHFSFVGSDFWLRRVIAATYER